MEEIQRKVGQQVKKILLALLLFLVAAGCSSQPEKKIIPRSELEKMPAVEKGATQK
jgi:hypothetical protein